MRTPSLSHLIFTAFLVGVSFMLGRSLSNLGGAPLDVASQAASVSAKTRNPRNLCNILPARSVRSQFPSVIVVSWQTHSQKTSAI